MGELRLEELSARNIVAANNLSLKPGQEQFIAPVSYSAGASVINPATSWQR
ncbi:acetyltransferase, partial [Cryobacterium sp. MLB-32]